MAGPHLQFAFALSVFLSLGLVSSHASIWDRSMFGYNVSQHTYDYDNRPVVPLVQMSYQQWWFHNHLDHPPHKEDVFELPAGQTITLEIACDKSATSYWESSVSGADIRDPNNPNDVCPGYPITQHHTNGIDDLGGCGLGIVYKDDVSKVQPEDFTIFSVNQTCVWDRFTDFQVPKRMPPCPNNMCICAFFWIHRPDSGSEQMYMNGFQCNVTDSTSVVGLATPKVARRCGADPDFGKPNADPGNCTYGAKQPFYWLQAERNNMYEGYYAPPLYQCLYNFNDGRQDDIFEDSYLTIPIPSPSQTELPTLNGAYPSPSLCFSVPVASGTASSGSATASGTNPSDIALSGSATASGASPSGIASDAGATASGTSPSGIALSGSATASGSSPSGIALSGSAMVSGASPSSTAFDTIPTNSGTSPSATSSGPGQSECSSPSDGSAFSRRHGHAARGNAHGSYGKIVF